MTWDLNKNDRFLTIPSATFCDVKVTKMQFYGLFLQGTEFHPKYTGENLTCTVEGLKRSTQYKFRVSESFFLCVIARISQIVCKLSLLCDLQSSYDYAPLSQCISFK